MKSAKEIFDELRKTHTEKRIFIEGDKITGTGLNRVYRTHREMVTDLFKQEGVEVYRFGHNYGTFNGVHPELGLVFLSTDSDIHPVLEVVALIGHNARYVQ